MVKGPVALTLRAALVVTGYVAAVGGAVAVALAFDRLFGLVLGVRMLTSLGDPFDYWLGVAFMGLVMTFVYALPGFVFALLLARRGGRRDPTFYAIAGLLNVIPSVGLLMAVAGSPVPPLPLLAACFPAGFAGGLAYWAVAIGLPGAMFDRMLLYRR